MMDYLCRCSNQGPGCQLLIDQGAGHYKTHMLCANSLGIMVSVFSHLHLVTEVMLMQMQYKVCTFIRESVDSLCRDGADTPIKP